MEETFRECVESERRNGRTVLLSSHILAEAEALADRITIIRAGRTVETGTLAELRHLTRYQVTASLDDGSSVQREVEPAELNDVLRSLTAVGVRSLTCRPPTLEEIFLKQYAS